MEDKKTNKKSLWYKLINLSYLGIREHSLTKKLLMLVSNVFEIISLSIVIDIICNYKRNWFNWCSLLYCLSPIYYSEYIKNFSYLQSNCTILPKEAYEYDQISLLHVWLFKTQIASDNCVTQFIITQWCIIITILILIAILLIKNQLIFVKYLKSFSAFIMYFIFKSLCLPTIQLYNYKLFIQISDSHELITFVFVFHILSAFIFNYLCYYFYKYLIYCYQSNSSYYVLNKTRFKTELIFNYLTVIIVTLRRTNNQLLIFKVLWSFTFTYYFYLLSYDFIYILNKSKIIKFNYFLITVLFSRFLTRIITMVMINFIADLTIFQIFEILINIVITIIIYGTVSSNVENITLSMIDNYLETNNELFFYGIHQLFSPLQKYFRLKSQENRMNDKHKEVFYNYYKKNIKENFCISKNDFRLLDMENSTKTPNSQCNQTINTNGTTQEKEYNSMLLVLVKLIDYFNKKAKLKRNLFGEKSREIIIYLKILLYFIIDDKTFRSEYYLKKFIYSKSFLKTNILVQVLFNGLSYHFRKLEKKGEDSSMSYMILFLYLNNEYLKITQAFSYILKNFEKAHEELLSIIDIQSKNIGSCFDKIINLNDKTVDNFKIKDQPENEKFKLVEDIMFNGNFDKSFEYFDLNSLDLVVEKNNYFIILYEENNFVIKKAPVEYFNLTGHKSTKMIDKQFVDIFPFVLKTIQLKNLKNTLLVKKTFVVDSVLETLDGYLVAAKLNFTMLPSFNGKLYLICGVECESKIEGSNVAIIQPSGYAQQFGLFFRHYFGLNTSIKKIDILNIFGIKDLTWETKTVQTFSINYSNMINELKKQLSKDMNLNKKDINDILTNIKKKFQNNTGPLLELVVKNCFTYETNNYYLIHFKFVDFKATTIPDKHVQEKDSICYPKNNHTFSGNSRSGSSVLSHKILKESNWNITNKRKKETYLSKNTLDQLSLFYNLLLIILAIGISVFVKLFSDEFYDGFLQTTSSREIALKFYYGQFYLSNMIVIEGSGNIHDIVNEEYSQTIPEYDIDIKDYYQKDFKILSSYFMQLYNNLINNFTNISPKDKLYNQFTKNITLILNSGNEVNETYLTQYNLPKNYFYILSKLEGYYIEIPLIPFDDVKNQLKQLEENQQYVLSLMVNTFTFFYELQDLLSVSKDVFIDLFKNYKSLIIVIFIIVLASNMFSLFMLYLSIRVSDKKMLVITDKLMAITIKHKNYLSNKAKVIKQIILNEMKPSIGLSSLKEKHQKMKPNIVTNTPDITNTNQTEEGITITNSDKDDNVPFISNRQKNEVYYFTVYRKSIRTLFFLVSVYLVFSIVSFPIIFEYLNQIESKYNESESSEDVLGLILMYYLDIKYSIFFNIPEKTDEIKLFSEFTQDIYNNYTLLNNKVFSQQSKEYVSYINIINTKSDCSEILNNDTFHNALNAVCRKEPILQTYLETMVSSFINELRDVYNNFITSKRTNEDIIKYFHDKNIQKYNYLITIYFIQFFTTLKNDYLLPSFESNITSLSNFLVIIFVLMVVAETLNYFLSTILVLKSLSNSLSNFNIIEKFFIYEAQNKKF